MNSVHYDHELLAERRKERMTQKDLADKIGVAELTLSRAENGSGVSYELLSNICTELDIDIREIIRPTSRAAKKFFAVT